MKGVARRGALVPTLLALALATFWFLLFPTWSAGAEPDPNGLVRSMIDATKVSFSARMKLSSPGGMVRIIEVRHLQEGDDSSTYMEITAPYILKGTRFLSFDRNGSKDEHYTFVPLVRRSVQVPQWTLEQSFLGSTFYMIDIAVPDMKEFRYVLGNTAQPNGRSCRKVEAEPLKPDYPYGRIVYCISEEIALSLTTEFYDRELKLLKVWTPQRIENVEGVWTPLQQTMENVQSQALSELSIEEIKQHAKLPAETFTKAYLDR